MCCNLVWCEKTAEASESPRQRGSPVRAHLPAPWQDILDLVYYSDWRKHESSASRGTKLTRPTASCGLFGTAPLACRGGRYQRTVARASAPWSVPPGTGLSRRCASTPSSTSRSPRFSAPRL